jgi:hypothetical protein
MPQTVEREIEVGEGRFGKAGFMHPVEAVGGRFDTLRRTFASMCFWAKRELPWVMDQIGDEDSRMTVEVYAGASKRKRVDRKLVWHSMRFADELKRAPGSGR